MSEPLSLVLEFARNDTPEDPYGFRFKPQDYTLRTAHGGRKRVHLAWSSEFLGDLDALHASSCDPAIVQRVGRALYGFLEPSGWTSHAQAIAAAVRRSSVGAAHGPLGGGRALRVALGAPAAGGRRAVRGRATGRADPLRVARAHTVPLQRARDPSRRRLLVAWSAAAGEVPAAEHIDAIGAACRAAGWEFKPGRT